MDIQSKPLHEMLNKSERAIFDSLQNHYGASNYNADDRGELFVIEERPASDGSGKLVPSSGYLVAYDIAQFLNKKYEGSLTSEILQDADKLFWVTLAASSEVGSYSAIREASADGWPFERMHHAVISNPNPDDRLYPSLTPDELAVVSEVREKKNKPALQTVSGERVEQRIQELQESERDARNRKAVDAPDDLEELRAQGHIIPIERGRNIKQGALKPENLKDKPKEPPVIGA